MTDVNVNDNLILICGESATGKSASLRYIADQKGVLYLNCESGKKLPFKNNYKQKIITNPHDVPKWFAAAETDPSIHTIVIDSSTFLMDMCETQFVLNVKDSMKGWSNFAQYWKALMQVCAANSTKNVIVLAHTVSEVNESTMEREVKVPVKGATKSVGIEAYFSSIFATKKIQINNLTPFLENNPLLVITPTEERVGYKHVFQTQLTKQTSGERIRGPIDMWTYEETYIDNNIQYVIDRHDSFYRLSEEDEAA